jgi:hypothetical protein
VPRLLTLLLTLVAATAAAQEVDVQAFLDASGPRLEGVSDEVARLSGAEPLPSGIAVRSRSIHHPDLALAEDHVLTTLGALPGLEVHTEDVEAVTALDGVPVTVSGLRNIIADLPGTDPALGTLVVSAHLDSTAKAEAGWDATTDPAPGADDDASGVAAVLGLAAAFASWEPGFLRSVRFVLFTAEEVGLQGSFAYVDALGAAGEDIDMVLQLDPIGYNGAGQDRLWFAYDPRWDDSVALVSEAADARGTWLEVQGVNRELLGSQAERSDHFPFWEAGIKALHFGAFPPPPDYHRTTDTLAVVDAAFLTEVSGVLLQLMAAQASPLAVADDPVCDGACCCASAGSGPSGAVVFAFLLALAPHARRRR